MEYLSNLKKDFSFVLIMQTEICMQETSINTAMIMINFEIIASNFILKNNFIITNTVYN